MIISTYHLGRCAATTQRDGQTDLDHQYLVKTQHPLTLCPMSNVALHVYEDISQHPAGSRNNFLAACSDVSDTTGYLSVLDSRLLTRAM